MDGSRPGGCDSWTGGRRCYVSTKPYALWNQLRHDI